MIILSGLKIILEVVGKFLAPLVFYLKGRSDVENKNLKENNKRLSNRPRTDVDVSNRLRAWRDKLKNKR